MSRMQFGENWTWKKNGREKEGYFATTDITFPMTDFDTYGQLWVALSKIDNMSIVNISYDHTERISYQNEARKKALTVARKKAGDMAAVLGVKIAEPLVIKDFSNDHFNPIMARSSNLYLAQPAIENEPAGSEAVALSPARFPSNQPWKLPSSF